MKGIKLCAECANYSMKLHKCLAGAVDEGKAQDPFYADCPLPDVVEVVRCKDCIYARPLDKYEAKIYLSECVGCNYHSEMYSSLIMMDTDFCSYGERKTDEK